jgi:hypothetical protein
MDQDPLIFEQLQKKDVSRLIDIARAGHAATESNFGSFVN